MANAFDLLGLNPRLVVDEEDLREAFRAAGKQTHPDAGGGEGEFSMLNEAFSVLSSPSRRLRCWMETHGLPVETRGTIDTELMDLFSDVGAVTQEAELLIRKRDEVKFALVRAMLEGQTQHCRESIEAAIAKVEERIEAECRNFPVLESSKNPDAGSASKIARNLVFLEKWRAALRSCYARLV